MTFVPILFLCEKLIAFLQMSVLVEQQDETITAIEAQAETVQKDTEAGCVLLF